MLEALKNLSTSEKANLDHKEVLVTSPSGNRRIHSRLLKKESDSQPNEAFLSIELKSEHDWQSAVTIYIKSDGEKLRFGLQLNLLTPNDIKKYSYYSSGRSGALRKNVGSAGTSDENNNILTRNGIMLESEKLPKKIKVEEAVVNILTLAKEAVSNPKALDDFTINSETLLLPFIK